VPLQQLLPSFFDIIGHFPPEQHVALPSELMELIAQVLPSLPLQQSPSVVPHLESFPQQLILPFACS
jgi:hypothetical protein